MAEYTGWSRTVREEELLLVLIEHEMVALKALLGERFVRWTKAVGVSATVISPHVP